MNNGKDNAGGGVAGLLAEHELILLCSRSVLTDKQVGRAGYLIAQKPDWQELLGTARFHRVFPLVSVNLVQHFRDAVPEHVVDELKTQCQKNSVVALFFSRQLLYLLNLFAGHGICAVPFKGPLLSDYLFGDVHWRSSQDLDILVAKNDLERAVLLLRGDGYGFDIDLDPDRFLRSVAYGFHAVMIKGGAACPVELHWELSGRYLARDMVMADVQGRLRRTRFLGQEVWTLSPEDLLVYLCIHGSRHFWLQLDCISSVAALLRKEEGLDWELVFRLAKAHGAGRMVLLGCLLASELLGVELNGLVTERIEKIPQVRNLSRRVAGDLFSSPEEKMRKLTYWSKMEYQWQIMDNLADRLRGGLRPFLQPTHSDWQWLRLPVSLSWLYYVLRPVRLGLVRAKGFFHEKGAGRTHAEGKLTPGGQDT